MSCLAFGYLFPIPPNIISLFISLRRALEQLSACDFQWPAAALTQHLEKFSNSTNFADKIRSNAVPGTLESNYICVFSNKSNNKFPNLSTKWGESNKTTTRVE